MSQRKAPSFKHTLQQSPYRSSINPSRSFGGVVAGQSNVKKKNNNKRGKKRR